jgi:hypothetical protein
VDTNDFTRKKIKRKEISGFLYIYIHIILVQCIHVMTDYIIGQTPVVQIAELRKRAVNVCYKNLLVYYFNNINNIPIAMHRNLEKMNHSYSSLIVMGFFFSLR